VINLIRGRVKENGSRRRNKSKHTLKWGVKKNEERTREKKTVKTTGAGGVKDFAKLGRDRASQPQRGVPKSGENGDSTTAQRHDRNHDSPCGETFRQQREKDKTQRPEVKNSCNKGLQFTPFLTGKQKSIGLQKTESLMGRKNGLVRDANANKRKNFR